MSDAPSQEETNESSLGPRKTPVSGDRPVITYDFKHPARVSKDQQRTMENLHSNLARLMASSYSTIQRSVVDCDIAFVDQTTYAEFIISLSNPSCCFTFILEPLGGPAVLDFPPAVANSFIDKQFGGTGGNPPKEARTIMPIERSVMANVVTRTLADLEATWEALLKVQVSDCELETNPEFMQIAAPSDTVVLIAFEVNSQRASGLITLCYPFFTLEPVMRYLNVQTWASRERGKGESTREERLSQLKSVEMEVTATWGRGTIPAEDVSALRVGDTLVLETRIDEPAVVYVGDQPVFLGRPGVGSRGRYAVELMRSIPQEEASRYA